MALYAIGDLQGCYLELRDLLEAIAFDPSRDRLLFTGDLVNRGPDSLSALRFVKSLGPVATTVLGNHDLHLLAVAYGISQTKRRDTFHDVLEAPDRDELLNWLRRQRLCHREGPHLLVHAGLAPQWSVDDALSYATEVESWLAGDDCVALLQRMYGNEPDHWSDDLSGWDRLRFIINACTRMRYCSPDGRLDFREKGAPGSQRPGLLPWYQIHDRRSTCASIVFGHWSTLGFHSEDGCHGLDTGCLWGGELTALRLDGDLVRTSVRCRVGEQGHQPVDPAALSSTESKD